jgi:hypothetical protein
VCTCARACVCEAEGNFQTYRNLPRCIQSTVYCIWYFAEQSEFDHCFISLLCSTYVLRNYLSEILFQSCCYPAFGCLHSVEVCCVAGISEDCTAIQAV